MGCRSSSIFWSRFFCGQTHDQRSHQRRKAFLQIAAVVLIGWPTSDASANLVAATLPTSRAVQVGTEATVFATLINTGDQDADGCRAEPVAGFVGDFFFQTTDPATNLLVGTRDVPVPIPGGSAQSFLLGITPNTIFETQDVQFEFVCNGIDPAPSFSGLNTLSLSSSAQPTADVVALSATASNDGVASLDGANGIGAFAVASVNVGAGERIFISADTGALGLPLNLSMCQTDPATGLCINPSVPSANAVEIDMPPNATPTVAVFASTNEIVPFDPAGRRVFVRFRDQAGALRGSTSVAVRTIATKISGAVTKGRVVGAVVRAYGTNAAGQFDESVELGSGRTDGAGQYELLLNRVYRGPLLLRVTNATSANTVLSCDSAASCGAVGTSATDLEFDSNANGVVDFGERYPSPAGFELSAAIALVPGETEVAANVSPPTTLAAHTLRATSGITNDRVALANSQVQANFGLRDSLTATQPIDLTDPQRGSRTDSELQEAAYHGLMASALAKIAQSRGETVSATLTRFRNSYSSTGGLPVSGASANSEQISLEEVFAAALDNAQSSAVAGRLASITGQAGTNTAAVDISEITDQLVVQRDSAASGEFNAVENAWNSGVWAPAGQSLNWQPTQPRSDLAPQAVAQASYQPGDARVVLNAGASTDDKNGNLSYAWRQIGGPRVSLQNNGAALAEFSAPRLDIDVEYQFVLTVTDERGLISTKTAQINVPAASPPVVDTLATSVVLSSELQAMIPTAVGVSSFVDSAQNMSAELADADTSQIVYLTDSADEPLTPVLVPRSVAQSGSVEVSADGIADAFIYLQPALLGGGAEDALRLLDIARTTPGYAALQQAVNVSLLTTPFSMMDEVRLGASSDAIVALRPQIEAATTATEFELAYLEYILQPAGQILLTVHPEFSAYLLANALASEAAALGMARSVRTINPSEFRAGPSRGPNVVQFNVQPSRGEFTIQNSTYLLYQYWLDGEDQGLIGARDSTLGSIWFENYPTLGDGAHVLTFGNGRGAAVNDLDDARVATANTLRAACLYLDAVFWCPLTADNFRALVSSDPEFAAAFRNLSAADGAQGLLAAVTLLFETSRDKLAGALISLGAQKRPSLRFAGHSNRFLRNVARFVTQPLSILSRGAPFAIDLFASEARVDIDVCEQEQEFVEAQLGDECNSEPKVQIIADPEPRLSREFEFPIGQEVVYSGVVSDVEDEDEDLRYAWSVELQPAEGGDSVFLTHSFDENLRELPIRHSRAGRVRIVLEVEDTGGAIGSALFVVLIEEDDALEFDDFVRFTVEETGLEYVLEIPPETSVNPFDPNDPSGEFDFIATSEIPELVFGVAAVNSFQLNLTNLVSEGPVAISGNDPVLGSADLDILEQNFVVTTFYEPASQTNPLVGVDSAAHLAAVPQAAPGTVSFEFGYASLRTVSEEGFFDNVPSAVEVATGEFRFTGRSLALPTIETRTVDGEFAFVNGECFCTYEDPATAYRNFIRGEGPTISRCASGAIVDLGVCPVIPAP